MKNIFIPRKGGILFVKLFFLMLILPAMNVSVFFNTWDRQDKIFCLTVCNILFLVILFAPGINDLYTIELTDDYIKFTNRKQEIKLDWNDIEKVKFITFGKSRLALYSYLVLGVMYFDLAGISRKDLKIIYKIIKDQLKEHGFSEEGYFNKTYQRIL